MASFADLFHIKKIDSGLNFNGTKISLELFQDMMFHYGINMVTEMLEVIKFEQGEGYINSLFECYKIYCKNLELKNRTTFLSFLNLMTLNMLPEEMKEIEIRPNDTIEEVIRRYKITHICKEEL